MKRKILNQKQRLIVAGAYILAIILVYWILGNGIGGIIKQNEPESIWFFSGILLVVLGKYVSEPYFSSPTDIFTNCLSLIIFLVGLSDGSKLICYPWLLTGAIVLFILSLLHMLFKDRSEKFRKVTYIILSKIGKSEVIFSAVYIAAAFSFFKNNLSMLFAALFLWVMMIPIDSISYLVDWISKCFDALGEVDSSLIGVAVHNVESEFYTVQVEKSDRNEKYLKSICDEIYIVKTESDSYSIGIAIRRINRIESLWIDLLLLNLEYDYQTIKSWGFYPDKSLEIGSTYIVSYASLPLDVKQKINSSKVFSKREKLIGFILPDSNLNLIRFRICDSKDRIKEGVIVETNILGEKVLYQVINGITKIESNGPESEEGYICGIARKMGKYDYTKKELQAVNWIPRMSEPVYICDVNTTDDFEMLAKISIGRLPGSDMIIPIKDINALVTHNTAVLGILGVGKSCLTFELIKKIVESGKKVICIDITNQYGSNEGLYGYLEKSLILNDFTEEVLKKISDSATKIGRDDNPKSWGNVAEYKEILDKWVDKFLDSKEKSVFIMNPDKHVVKKAASLFKISDSIDVSLVEKVQIISECILKKCMDRKQTAEARCCLVFEEAHALTPENNSVVVKDDGNHANGTAKVILQGRKYGLGCIVVTQRTANVTKSILNQCNTIFALRLFDETGKAFLENYIGKDYSDVLPTLDERHAVVVGKGVGLKQPAIIQLNDKKFLKNSL